MSDKRIRTKVIKRHGDTLSVRTVTRSVFRDLRIIPKPQEQSPNWGLPSCSGEWQACYRYVDNIFLELGGVLTDWSKRSGNSYQFPLKERMR